MASSPGATPDAPEGLAAPAGSSSRAGGKRKRTPAGPSPPPLSSASPTLRSGRHRRLQAAQGLAPSPAAAQPSCASGTAAEQGWDRAAAAANGGAEGGKGMVPSQQPGQQGCTHCGVGHSWRWRKHPDTQLRLCSTCWDYMRAHGGEERPVNVCCLHCSSDSPGTGRGVNGSWHPHPATGERWLCSPCFFVARRQAEQRQCAECGSSSPGTCKSAAWHRSPTSGSWLCTRCHGRAYEQVKKLRRQAFKQEPEGGAVEEGWAAAGPWPPAELSPRPPSTRRRTATHQQEWPENGAAGASATAASQPTTPSMALEAAAAAGVLSALALDHWAAEQLQQQEPFQAQQLTILQQQQQQQLLQPEEVGEDEGWAGGQPAAEQGQPGTVAQQDATLAAGEQAGQPVPRQLVAQQAAGQQAVGHLVAQQAAGQQAAGQLPPGDLFVLLLALADTAAGQGLTRPLVASFYALLDVLPPEQKALREWRLLRLLCDGSFDAAAQMMATALHLAGTLA